MQVKFVFSSFPEINFYKKKGICAKENNFCRLLMLVAMGNIFSRWKKIALAVSVNLLNHWRHVLATFPIWMISVFFFLLSLVFSFIYYSSLYLSFHWVCFGIWTGAILINLSNKKTVNQSILWILLSISSTTKTTYDWDFCYFSKTT